MHYLIWLLSLVSVLPYAQSQHSTTGGPYKPPHPSGVMWGAASTNSVRAGLKGDRLEYFLWVEAKSAQFLVLPVANQRFALILKNAAGADVPRTSEGKKTGKPLAMDQELQIDEDVKRQPISWRGVTYRTRLLFTDAPQILDVIELRKYSKIKTPGQYTLTVEARYFLAG